MLDPVFKSDTYQLAQRLLDAAAMRQDAIAANIANAETPAYKRLDVSKDFAAQLRTQLARGEPLTSDFVQPKIVEDTQAKTTRPDGNTVEIEHELVEMNRNAVEYQFLSEVVSRDLKQLRLAISGRSA